MENHSAIKRKARLTCNTTGMNLKNIVLSERRQTQKTTHIVQFHLYEVSRKGKTIWKER